MQAHDLIRRSECGAVQPGDKIFRLLSSPFEDWAVITFCLLRGSQLTPHTSHLTPHTSSNHSLMIMIYLVLLELAVLHKLFKVMSV